MTRSVATRGPAALMAVALLAGCATGAPAPVESRAGGARPATSEPALARAPGTSAANGVQTFPAATPGTPTWSSTPGAQVPSWSEPRASAPAPTAPDSAQAPLTPAASGTRASAPEPGNPAVVALLNHANQETRSGRHATAAASLERAIKIDPGNPWLWHRLALTRLEQGRPGEAASLAAKSNSLAAGDPGVQAENWLLIARVHRQRGEEVAARAAEERARMLMPPSS